MYPGGHVKAYAQLWPREDAEDILGQAEEIPPEGLASKYCDTNINTEGRKKNFTVTAKHLTLSDKTANRIW